MRLSVSAIFCLTERLTVSCAVFWMSSARFSRILASSRSVTECSRATRPSYIGACKCTTSVKHNSSGHRMLNSLVTKHNFRYFLGTSVLREYAIAAYFVYCRIFRIFQRNAHIAYFFPTAILILFVFLLPPSIRFRYLDHLVANRIAPSMCLDPCETR